MEEIPDAVPETVTTTNPAFTADSSEAVGIRDVTVRFDGVPAVAGAHLSVGRGEFVALLGPSGCGKSTLLNVVAGLLQPDEGEIRLDGAPVEQRRGRTAYMPQRDALLPWRSVIDNAILGLEVAGRSKSESRQRAGEMLPRFGLRDTGNLYPAALSGGMRQRVAFLRTVLTDHQVLLLDEPFGALDALTRREMQEWLLDLWSELGRTILMVTHDVEEALLLADRVAVMTARPGRIKLTEKVQLPRPRHADMIGDPVLVKQKVQLLQALRSEMSGMESRT